MVWIIIIFLSIFIFLLVGKLRFTKGYENTWLFIFIAIAFSPMNILYGWRLADSLFWLESDLFKFVWTLVFIFAFLSADEIVLGIIGRLVWQNQQEYIDEDKNSYLESCMDDFEDPLY
ncbi:MAG: hypothetical protein MJ107_03765 [Lachnospiraceae bacterium]|nr:hypothetical protein [Lachnospiraceae bacterium]